MYMLFNSIIINPLKEEKNYIKCVFVLFTERHNTDTPKNLSRPKSNFKLYKIIFHSYCRCLSSVVSHRQETPQAMSATIVFSFFFVSSVLKKIKGTFY